MEQFLIDHPAVGYILILGLLSIIAWLVKMAISNQLKRMDSHSNRMDGIETNYKDEFKKIRMEANDRHLEVLGVLTEVRVEIAELKGNNHNK